MLPSPTLILGAILAVILSFGGGFISGDIHRGSVDQKDQAIEVAKANDSARQIEQQVAGAQNIITKSTLKEKDAIEQKRSQFISSLNPVSTSFGLRQSSTSLSVGTNSAAGVGGQALRFSRTDAEFLNNFAAECSISEAERNEVILKYEALP
jgi:hypothetical protein